MLQELLLMLATTEVLPSLTNGTSESFGYHDGKSVLHFSPAAHRATHVSHLALCAPSVLNISLKVRFEVWREFVSFFTLPIVQEIGHYLQLFVDRQFPILNVELIRFREYCQYLVLHLSHLTF